MWSSQRFLSTAMSFSILMPGLLAAQHLQPRIETEKGGTRGALAAHPLRWWTSNPLRLDTSGDLMLGFKAPDGLPITAKDYRVEQQVVPIGVLAGHEIVQVNTSITPGSRVIAAGFAVGGGDAAEWKDLLAGTGKSGMFAELYGLRIDGGRLVRESKARVYGFGLNAILGTYDPDTGNGGGCWEGYWWFDRFGPHEVDFAPFLTAVSRALPADATFTPGCWALHPDASQLKSGVQRRDAQCHACGGLGEVTASYRIEHGLAKPVSVSFTPE